MSTQNHLIFIVILFSLSLKAQDTIAIRDNPISMQKDGIYAISQYNNSNSYPDKNSNKQYTTYPYGLTSKYFKSLIVDNNNIGIELTKSGKEKFKANFRVSSGETLAYVFSDTIYQMQKIDSTLLNSKYFLIENLSKKEKEKLIYFYKNLPSEKIQKSLQQNLRNHNFKKADSLLQLGAFIMEKFEQRRVYYDAYSNRDTLLIAYFDTIKYKQKANSIYDAITIEDIDFIGSYFKNLKNKPEFKKNLNSKFMDAADHSSKEIVELLLNYGADINYKRRGYTALTFSAGFGEIEVFDFLISKSLTEDDLNIFFTACRYNNQFMIDHLIKKGYDINMQDKDGFSALHYLLNDGEFKRTTFLINRGIDVNLVDNNGNTALHKLASLTYADFKKRIQNYSSRGLQSEDLVRIANRLIENGIDVSLKNKKGFTALDVAKGAEGVSDERAKPTNNELIALLEKLKK